MRQIPFLMLLILLPLTIAPSVWAQTASPAQTAADIDDLSINAADQFVRVDRLDYNDFRVLRQRKNVQIQNANGSTEVSYAVVQQNGKTVLTFDDARLAAPNSTEFNLFPLLGGAGKQLIVSQTVPRTGRHWVVNFGKQAELIFDSGDYNVGREDFVENDINSNGAFEILLPSLAFLNFPNVNETDAPLPEIIFEFDKKLGKYAPANPKFAAFALRDINERIAAISRNDKDRLFADVLDIMLRRIYAGQETAAWQFYESEYNFGDKAARKNQILNVLQTDPVYRFLFPEKVQNEVRSL